MIQDALLLTVLELSRWQREAAIAARAKRDAEATGSLFKPEPEPITKK